MHEPSIEFLKDWNTCTYRKCFRIFNSDSSIQYYTSVKRIKFLGNEHFIPRGLAVIVMMCTIAN